MTILGWFEHVQEEDVPPEHLWDDDEGLDHWWKKVKAKRAAEYGAGADDTILADEDMMGNDIARAFKDS